MTVCNKICLSGVDFQSPFLWQEFIFPGWWNYWQGIYKWVPFGGLSLSKQGSWEKVSPYIAVFQGPPEAENNQYIKVVYLKCRVLNLCLKDTNKHQCRMTTVLLTGVAGQGKREKSLKGQWNCLQSLKQHFCLQVLVTVSSLCPCRHENGKAAVHSLAQGTSASHTFVNNPFIEYSLKFLILVGYLNPDWKVSHASFINKFLEDPNHQYYEEIKIRETLRYSKQRSEVAK